MQVRWNSLTCDDMLDTLGVNKRAANKSTFSMVDHARKVHVTVDVIEYSPHYTSLCQRKICVYMLAFYAMHSLSSGR